MGTQNSFAICCNSSALHEIVGITVWMLVGKPLSLSLIVLTIELLPMDLGLTNTDTVGHPHDHSRCTKRPGDSMSFVTACSRSPSNCICHRDDFISWWPSSVIAHLIVCLTLNSNS